MNAPSGAGSREFDFRHGCWWPWRSLLCNSLRQPPMALPGTGNWVLGFRLRLQLHLSTLHLDRVDHCIAAVLLANFAGLFLDECGERIEVAGDLFSRLVLGFGQRLVKGFDLRPLGRRARAQYRERRIAPWIGSRSLSALGGSL